MSNLRVTILQTCPNCGKDYTPELANFNDFPEKMLKWRDGGRLIQTVWPEATAMQREQLQTGLCSDQCWDAYLGVEPEDNMTDAEADADTLRSAGMGTDEDYGNFGGNDGY